MTSNIDKEVFNPDETVIVSVWDENTMDEGIYSLDMKGRLKKLAEGPYIYSIHRFLTIRSIVSGIVRIYQNSVICGGVNRISLIRFV